VRWTAEGSIPKRHGLRGGGDEPGAVPSVCCELPDRGADGDGMEGGADRPPGEPGAAEARGRRRRRTQSSQQLSLSPSCDRCVVRLQGEGLLLW